MELKISRKRPDLAERNRKNATHKMSDSPTYVVWRAMTVRCKNPNTKSYDKYGGSGITVCKRWEKFSNFLKDMGTRPKGMQIDRIDNSKGYTKSNCRWATRKQQANNRRSNVWIWYADTAMTIKEWADHTGISDKCIRYRIKAGWDLADVFNVKPHRGNGWWVKK